MAHVNDPAQTAIANLEAALNKAAAGLAMITEARESLTGKAAKKGTKETVTPMNAIDTGHLYGWKTREEAEAEAARNRAADEEDEQARSDGGRPRLSKADVRAKVRALLQEMEEAASYEAQKSAAVRMIPLLPHLAKGADLGADFLPRLVNVTGVEPAFVGKGAIGRQTRLTDDDLGGVDTSGDGMNRTQPALDRAPGVIGATKIPGAQQQSLGWSVKPADSIVSQEAARQKGNSAFDPGNQEPPVKGDAFEAAKLRVQINPQEWRAYGQRKPGAPADDSSTFRKLTP